MLKAALASLLPSKCSWSLLPSDQSESQGRSFIIGPAIFPDPGPACPLHPVAAQPLGRWVPGLGQRSTGDGGWARTA